MRLFFKLFLAYYTCYVNPVSSFYMPWRLLWIDHEWRGMILSLWPDRPFQIWYSETLEGHLNFLLFLGVVYLSKSAFSAFQKGLRLLVVQSPSKEGRLR